MLGVDIMGPLDCSSHRHEYLLVFVDYYSWRVELLPLRNATAQTVASHLREDILTQWGVPDFILSNRGKQFTSAIFQNICAEWKVNQKITTTDLLYWRYCCLLLSSDRISPLLKVATLLHIWLDFPQTLTQFPSRLSTPTVNMVSLKISCE